MDKNVRFYFDKLLDSLNEEEQYYQKIRDNIFDIEDFDEQDRIDKNARTYIRDIRSWKKELNKINTEMLNSGLFDKSEQVNITEDEKKTTETTKDKFTNESFEEERTEVSNNRPEINNSRYITFTLFNKEYRVKFWYEILIRICETMLIMKPFIVARFDKNSNLNSDIRTNYSYEEDKIKFSKKRLSNGMWVCTNRSSGDIINECKKILVICGYSENDLRV